VSVVVGMWELLAFVSQLLSIPEKFVYTGTIFFKLTTIRSKIKALRKNLYKCYLPVSYATHM
jgi:hypothetical protein